MCDKTDSEQFKQSVGYISNEASLTQFVFLALEISGDPEIKKRLKTFVAQIQLNLIIKS